MKLDCSAEGHPRPTVTWYKDGARFLKRKGGRRLYLDQWTLLLSILDLVPTDTGKYTCNVSNAYGWINHTYYVDVHGKIKVLDRLSGLTFPLAHFFAKKQRPLHNIIPAELGIMFKNNLKEITLRMRLTGSLTHHPVTSTLLVLRVIFIAFTAFKGVACYITDDDNQECGNSFLLTSLKLYDIYVSPLTLLERARAEPVVLPMKNVTVHEGQNATLLCKALSDSMPHFQWLRWHSSPSNGTTHSTIEHPHYEVIKQNLQVPDEHLVLSKSNNKFDFHGVKLTLVNVTKEDEGKYLCIVGNAVGYAVEQAYIILKRKNAGKK